jgi:hypothetical protein
MEEFLNCVGKQGNKKDIERIADSEINGMLLRADIHAFFDDYQFAFNRTVRFIFIRQLLI